MKPLRVIKVVTLAVNVPGPGAASRLRQLGAEVIRVEPPTGEVEGGDLGHRARSALSRGAGYVRLNPNEKAQG